MSTPQNPARRRKQKARRTKQLAAWRDKHPKKEESGGATAPTPGAARASK
jgi:hypothetical protein